MIDNIVKAAKLIWYDNGMINRLESETVKLTQLKSWLEMSNRDIVKLVDDELSGLSEETLYDICCGCSDSSDVSEITNDLLNGIFNEEYSNKNIDGIYDFLAHGSEDHREWLKKALSHYFNGTELPEYKQ